MTTLNQLHDSIMTTRDLNSVDDGIISIWRSELDISLVQHTGVVRRICRCRDWQMRRSEHEWNYLPYPNAQHMDPSGYSAR